MALYLYDMMHQSWHLLRFLLVLLSFVTPLLHPCHCQTTSPQNIETFYPNEASAPAPASTQPPKPPPPPPPSTQAQPAPEPVSASKSSSSNSKIAKAVAATAAGSIVVCGLVFILVQRCLRARRRREMNNTASSATDSRVVPQGNVFERIDGNVKGFIVDEDGLDVIYWRKLEGKNPNMDLQKEVFHSPKNKEEEEIEEDGHEGTQGKKSNSIHEIPLLRGKSSTSHINVFSEEKESFRFRIPPPVVSPPINVSASVGATIKGVEKPDSPIHPSTPPPPPSSPPTPSSSNSFSAIPKMNNTASSTPSPPISERKSPTPPPPPSQIPATKSPAPPRPPPLKAGSLYSSSKPLSDPIKMPVTSNTSNQRNTSGKGMPETGNDQVKLKPLHWDKVNTNADHSMVWGKVDRGSFRVNQDLMEALFGYVATNRRSPRGKSNSTSPSRDASAPSAKTFLLDPRKSQNIAIVLKSLAISKDEILDALNDGKGLDVDTIEKLARVAPTEEDQTLILEYKGDPARLAAAESFLYHILKAFPSAFKHLNAMLFRLNYESEILEIKKSLETLELGCKELKNKGLFVKLLEAVLKAGNRMNAGTARGNAQAFNLASLRKLSDVKSTDGKTTLLHFVVEEVVRSEGKRAFLNRNRNHSLSRSSSRSSYGSRNSESENSASSNERRQREYITIGLPIVGGISSELSNVNKAALIDYNNLVGLTAVLSTRIFEIQELVSQCGNDGGGNFVKEMEQFLEKAEKELKLVRDEKTRVMQLIKRTAEYYQVGASKDTAHHNLQLFVVVKDFLSMVDQACIEIARNMQKRMTPKASSQ